MQNTENDTIKQINLNTYDISHKEEGIDRFRRMLEAKNLPKETIEKYIAVAEKFIKTIGNKPKYTKDDVTLFLSNEKRAGKKGATLRFYFTCIKRFFKALELPWEFDVGDAPHIEEQYQPMFEPEEITAMERVAEKRGLRDLVLVRLAYTVGLRRIEISRLDRNDYRRPEIYVKTAKHGLPVWNLLDEKTCNILESYLATRKDRNPAMFVRGHGKARLSPRALSHILKSIREEAGVNKPRAGFHAARRLQVTRLDEAGITPKQITIYKGWKDDRTVLRYTKPKPEKIKEKIRQIINLE
ncbi:MAG: tyrosine-type recombinase/integrase [Candidatus Bathyarchaeia archaeon]